MRQLERFLFLRKVIAANVCLFVLTLVGSAVVVVAQTGTATVRGTITDAQGKAVPNATVKLVASERNFERVQTASSEGGYVFNAIPPGEYRVEVESANFRKTRVDNVNAAVDTTRELNVQLEVGNFTESLNVSAGSEAPLNTADATIGNAFESKRILELPLNARNIVGLLSLQPGVNRGGEVTGGRRDQANIRCCAAASAFFMTASAAS